MKQKLKQNISYWRRMKALPVLVFASFILVAATVVPNVRADQFDDQIAALQEQNAKKQGVLNDLQSKASSYQDAINRLQAQINDLQAKIDVNKAKQAELQQKIVEAQAELDQQREVLGESIKAMYVDGQPTTIEMLAASESLSEFVDKEEYRSALQSKIQETLAKIRELQSELKKQKQAVEDLLRDQQAQQASLDASRAQQSQLLAYNQNQQTAYNNAIKANQSKIADLRRQQAILNSQYNIGSIKSSLCGGGYPASVPNSYGERWGCKYPLDNTIDLWGMYNRECVSYTAFKVHEDYVAGRNNRDMPYWGGIGNANQWDDNARRAGIPVNSSPSPGSIAISNSGTWGHAMYVEAVGTINGQKAVYVSQYNSGFDGRYSEGWRYTTGLVFIHF